MWIARSDCTPSRGAVGGSQSSGERIPANTKRRGRSASARTSARPMPRLAPVTSAVRPVRTTAQE
jgi:hypothetical protein